MPLNPSGAISLAGPVAGQSIAVELGQSATATISLNDTNVRTLAQKPSGVIVMPTDFYGKSNFVNTQRAIFGFGFVGPAYTNATNLVSSTGVMASDTPGVGTPRGNLAASTYGGDKAIFGLGFITAQTAITSLVSNTGVVAADTPGAPGVLARSGVAAAGYGSSGQAIFGFGSIPSPVRRQNRTNLVSNTGVMAADTPGVGTPRTTLAAASYGGDKAIFGFGQAPATVSVTNLVSNTGVVATDTPGVGTVRNEPGAANYGGDKAIFGFGAGAPGVGPISSTCLVSNTGVVAADTPGAPGVLARQQLGAAGYGNDKAIFGFGNRPNPSVRQNITNLVSNTGVVASDTPGVGTAREALAAAGYSLTA